MTLPASSGSSSPDSDIPKKLGRFDLVEKLGEGSMGIVYLARDPMIGRWVALKKLTGIKGKSLGPEAVRRLLLTEARNTGALEHPGIITVFDVIEDDEGEVAALAMEYLPGRSLRQRFKDSDPIPLHFAGEVVAAVADVLDYAHENGCIHRDIKPANILLGSDGSIKVADFGISALRGQDLATELKTLGTPNYLAPERIMGDPGDHRADVYSLGVILYELLTRQLPFKGESIGELVQLIVQEPPTPPDQYVSDLLPSLSEVLSRALEKDPNDRFQSAGELAAAVQEVVAAQANMNETVPAGQVIEMEVLPSVNTRRESPPEASDSAGRVSVEALDLVPAELNVAEFATETQLPPGSDARDVLDVNNLASATDPASLEPPVAPIPVAEPEGGRFRFSRLPVGLSLAAAAAVFVAALPLLLWAFRSSEASPPAAQAAAAGSAAIVEDPALRQHLGLVRESHDLVAAGDFATADALLSRAETLLSAEEQASRLREQALQQVATEREAERLASIEAVSEEFETRIRREDFRGAEALLTRLAELEALPEDVSLQTASLEQARVRARRTRQQRAQAAEREAQIAAAQAQRAQFDSRAVRNRAAPMPTGPGTVRIDFATERAKGQLTVFANGEQVLERSYRFVEKKNFLIRKAVGGFFTESIELPHGKQYLKISLTQPRRGSQQKTVAINVPPGGSSTLQLRVAKDGKLAISAR